MRHPRTIFLSLAVLCLAFIAVGCSVTEEKQASDALPQLAPATQAVEKIQQKLDPIAEKAEQGANAVAGGAKLAEGLGVPGASTVALIATALGTALGAYGQHRKGTLPLKTAVAQIVKSVEQAFPQKTAEQKAALAAVQDLTTKRIVDKLKTT